jgi:hypothetical protein
VVRRQEVEEGEEKKEEVEVDKRGTNRTEG